MWGGWFQCFNWMVCVCSIHEVVEKVASLFLTFFCIISSLEENPWVHWRFLRRTCTCRINKGNTAGSTEFILYLQHLEPESIFDHTRVGCKATPTRPESAYRQPANKSIAHLFQARHLHPNSFYLWQKQRKSFSSSRQKLLFNNVYHRSEH